VVAVATHRFDFRFTEAYWLAALPFGVRPPVAWVEVDDQWLRARYGPWRVSTPLCNVSKVEATGPYAFAKTAGPARLGVTDLGLTFASNSERGVLISFYEKVRGIDPLGLLRHPELTVTVEEVEGLASLLAARTR
jgi:hypothetical protein